MSSSRGPMLINLPPPPSDPVTPNEHGPGTPNSTTTSLSALSVVAIKDGSIGHGGRGAHSSANTLEAERADRISRLAGLERVATVRTTPSGHVLPGGGPQYDNAVPHLRERSTVGSASATGSVGGKTTWASESVNDPDKMSEDQDDGNSSLGGYGDEDNASLVGFGEGANSTVSGPISTANARMLAARHIYMAQNQNTPRTGYISSNSGQGNSVGGTYHTGIVGTDPKMMDGMTYDANLVDTPMQNMSPINHIRPNSNSGGAGTEMAESIMRDRIDDTESGSKAMGTPDSKSLGKFAFEQ